MSGVDQLGLDSFSGAAAGPPTVGLGEHHLPTEQCSERNWGRIPYQLLFPLLFNQVIDIPEALLEDHDLTVDYILTPTRVIATGCERPKPTGITWSKVGHYVASRAATVSCGQLWAVA